MDQGHRKGKQLSSNWEALALALYQKMMKEESGEVKRREVKTEEEEQEDELVQSISSDQTKRLRVQKREVKRK
ncbi:hypothetical protein [Priestia endophytica]|uniref:hypothetical protein n=1 Tax=Priestia endophytica TaxID=135735 RepID=UPI00227F8148|nr:hypothetical protein [Priestia endophytica]MCY8231718.1 hypothetical protein [Priestia endophytica]